MRGLATAATLAASLALVSCTGGNGSPSVSPSASPSSSSRVFGRVTIHGRYVELGVSRPLPNAGSCTSVGLPPGAGASGVLTFYDAGDRVIGRSRLAHGAPVRFGHSCVPSWSFRATLPRETTYAARGPSAGAQMQPAQITYSDLAAHHFAWTIEVR